MGKKKNSKPQDRGNENSNFDSFKIVLFYCLLIIFMPIVTFFATKSFIFDGYLELNTISSNIFSAISAVISLHIALGLYIYRAYFEAKTSDKKAE
uniref:Vacuolar ATPase assembly integral membrane protein VMA21 homolog n=1 Tax=Tabanus bromius TaxID=304241 RepID=A0A0K8TPH2_TABBR